MLLEHKFLVLRYSKTGAPCIIRADKIERMKNRPNGRTEVHLKDGRICTVLESRRFISGIIEEDREWQLEKQRLAEEAETQKETEEEPGKTEEVEEEAKTEGWRYVLKDGNPEEPGVYWTTLIYDECKDNEFTGRKCATVESRMFADLDKEPFLAAWIMNGQPETGLAWTQESGSWYNEEVWAWKPVEEIEMADLPSGVVKGGE